MKEKTREKQQNIFNTPIPKKTTLSEQLSVQSIIIFQPVIQGFISPPGPSAMPAPAARTSLSCQGHTTIDITSNACTAQLSSLSSIG